jgi:hypothetical protein
MSELAYDVSYTPDEPIEHVKSWRHNHCNGACKLEKQTTSNKGTAWQRLGFQTTNSYRARETRKKQKNFIVPG